MPFEIDRKQFLKAAAAVTVAAAWSALPRLAAADAAASKAAAVKTTEVAPGIHVHQGLYEEVEESNAGNISNMSFIVGKEAIAVVDTGSSALLGASLRQAVESISKLPIRYVINTHMHPDHVLGNIAFKDLKPEYVAHHNMARALAIRAKGYLDADRERLGEQAFAGTEVVLPTRPIKEPTEIDLGERKLRLVPRQTAHTNNDLTIHDLTTNIMLTGDLIFAKRMPTLDGSILGWVKVLEAFEQENFNQLVPGHGPALIAKADAIRPLKTYLTTVIDGVRKAIKDGKTITDAVKTVGLSEKANWVLFDDNHARNVTAAFAELEWE